MSKSICVLATLLLAIGGISANAADETFTVRIENVSAANALKLSNGKTEPVDVAPVLYVVHPPLPPNCCVGQTRHRHKAEELDFISFRLGSQRSRRSRIGPYPRLECTP